MSSPPERGAGSPQENGPDAPAAGPGRRRGGSHRRPPSRGVRLRRTIIGLCVVVATAGVLLGLSIAPSGGGHHHPSAGGTTTNPTLPPTTTTTFPTSLGAGVRTVTWTDPSRSTEDYATGTSTPGRVLRTEIRYPTLTATPAGELTGAAPAYKYGPYPVIVFAHGFDITPDAYTALLDDWARAGYVVVAPVFPDTNSVTIAAAGGPSTGNWEEDIGYQPQDLAFVIARVARAANPVPATAGTTTTSTAASTNGSSTTAVSTTTSTTATSSTAATTTTSGSTTTTATAPPSPAAFLRGLANTTEIGLAGQSDGGDTVAALAYDSYFAGRVRPPAEVRAVAVLSGGELYMGQGSYTGHRRASLLVVQSDTDACNLPSTSATLYDAVATPHKWFLELHGATHLGPYTGVDPASRIVAGVTTQFFDAYLRHVLGSLVRMRGGPRASPALAALSGQPTAPAMPYVAANSAACYAQG